MSSTEGAAAGDGLPEPETSYRAPAQKTVEEILTADAEDESLRKYKEQLLGAGAGVIIDGDNPKNVLVRSLTLLVDGREDVTMDLTGDIKTLENSTFHLKEACKYRLKINFHVQREIVAGLKYVQNIHRMGIPVDKDEYMVGSYPPKSELQSYTTPYDEAPSGMMHRGTYKIKSLFTDDDKHEWLKWEWTLEIQKDW